MTDTQIEQARQCAASLRGEAAARARLADNQRRYAARAADPEEERQHTAWAEDDALWAAMLRVQAKAIDAWISAGCPDVAEV